MTSGQFVDGCGILAHERRSKTEVMSSHRVVSRKSIHVLVLPDVGFNPHLATTPSWPITDANGAACFALPPISKV